MPAPAAAAARITAGLEVSTETITGEAVDDRLDQWNHPAQFLVIRHILGARTGGLTADIDDVGTIADHAFGLV